MNRSRAKSSNEPWEVGKQFHAAASPFGLPPMLD
jgi:hypothetical protein